MRACIARPISRPSAIRFSIADGVASSLSPSLARGVCHPVRSVPDVRRPEARSRGNDRPAGVAQVFHVSLYKVEPSEAVTTFNLLSKDDWRAALADEMVERGPEVPLVSKPSAFASCAERLARATCSPDRSTILATSRSEGVRPYSDAREKVTLVKLFEFVGSDILDAPFINVAGRDVARGDQVAQPLRGERVDFVVVGDHACSSKLAPASSGLAGHDPLSPSASHTSRL